jgi:hypothetical protein
MQLYSDDASIHPVFKLLRHDHLHPVEQESVVEDPVSSGGHE